MHVALLAAPFDPWMALARHAATLAPGTSGACVNFVGSVRDFSDGASIKALHLEHYPGMTERHLAMIAEEVQQRWPLQELLILHRVGTLVLGEPIVLIATWSAHRSAAFAACRHLIEELKNRAPFWKKETLAAGERWVGHNTPN